MSDTKLLTLQCVCLFQWPKVRSHRDTTRHSLYFQESLQEATSLDKAQSRRINGSGEPHRRPTRTWCWFDVGLPHVFLHNRRGRRNALRRS